MKLFKLRSNPDYDKTTEYSARLGNAITIKPNAKIAFKSIYLDGSVRDNISLESSVSFKIYSSSNYGEIITIPQGLYTRQGLMKTITDALNTSYYIRLVDEDGNITPVPVKSDGASIKSERFIGMDWNALTDSTNNYKCSIAFNCGNSLQTSTFVTTDLIQNGNTYSTQQNNLYSSYAMSKLPISRGCNYVVFVMSALPAPSQSSNIAFIFGIYNGLTRADETQLSENDYDCCFTIAKNNKVFMYANETFTDLNVVATANMKFYIMPEGNLYKFYVVSADGTQILGTQATAPKKFTNDNVYTAFTICNTGYSVSSIYSINSPYYSIAPSELITYTPTMDFGINSSKLGGGVTSVAIDFTQPIDTRILQNILGFLTPRIEVSASQYTFKATDQIDSDGLEDVSINIQNLDISSYDTSKSVGFKTPTIMTIDSLSQTVSAGGSYSYDVPTPVFIEMNNTTPISLSSFLVRITSQNQPIDMPNGICSITVLIDDSGK